MQLHNYVHEIMHQWGEDLNEVSDVSEPMQVANTGIE